LSAPDEAARDDAEFDGSSRDQTGAALDLGEAEGGRLLPGSLPGGT
jgi:hypothetical protein